jgi:hypothetical protein
MAGTIVADTIQADSTSTLVLKNGVANTPPTIQDNAGTQIGTFCRAWVNFNGTGTVAIRASFNVTSITDHGTGDYTVNFTNALPDASYAFLGSCGRGISSQDSLVNENVSTIPTTSAVRFGTTTSAGTLVDMTYVNVSIFR